MYIIDGDDDDGRLADDVLVCRGGACMAHAFQHGSGVTLDAAGKLRNVSATAAPGRKALYAHGSKSESSMRRLTMSASTFENISDQELSSMEKRARSAAAAPWCSLVEGRDYLGGLSFIQTPVSDIELWEASAADQDFIAHARDDIPRLLVEIRYLRSKRG
jgi:hypothetical protein